MTTERRGTAAVFTLGTLAAAACLLFGLVLTVAGASLETGQPTDGLAVLRAVVELRPWGWTMAGVLILLLTPALGLVTTFLEMRPVEPRAAWLAVAVLGVLAAAVLIALR